LFAEGRFDQARPVYLRLLPSDPRNFHLNRSLGLCFANSARPDLPRAIAYFETALAVQEDEGVRIALARAYIGAGRPDDGFRFWRALADQHPQHPEHWREYAEPLAAAGRTAEAVTETGWWSAKAWSHPGIVSTGTNAEEANTSGAMIGKAAAWAVSGSPTASPTNAKTHESASPSVSLDVDENRKSSPAIPIALSAARVDRVGAAFASTRTVTVVVTVLGVAPAGGWSVIVRRDRYPAPVLGVVYWCTSVRVTTVFGAVRPVAYVLSTVPSLLKSQAHVNAFPSRSETVPTKVTSWVVYAVEGLAVRLRMFGARFRSPTTLIDADCVVV